MAQIWHNSVTMKVAVVPPTLRIARTLESHGYDVRRVRLGSGRVAPQQGFDVVVFADAGDVPVGHVVFEQVAVTFPNTPWVFASDRLTSRVASTASEAGALLTTLEGIPRTIANLERLMKPSKVTPSSDVVEEFHDPSSGRLDATRVAAALGLAVSALAPAVGVTASALSKRPTARAAQKGLREIEFTWATLRRMLGSDPAVRAWLNGPHPDLGGQPPISLLTEGSATALADYVRSALIGQPT